MSPRVSHGCHIIRLIAQFGGAGQWRRRPCLRSREPSAHHLPPQKLRLPRRLVTAHPPGEDGSHPTKAGPELPPSSSQKHHRESRRRRDRELCRIRHSPLTSSSPHDPCHSERPYGAKNLSCILPLSSARCMLNTARFPNPIPSLLSHCEEQCDAAISFILSALRPLRLCVRGIPIPQFEL